MSAEQKYFNPHLELDHSHIFGTLTTQELEELRDKYTAELTAEGHGETAQKTIGQLIGRVDFELSLPDREDIWGILAENIS